ncbi:MBOAT family protein [Duganella sp. FT94W]|uniref:Probable alginate O-acetylase AlgI n=1 Tax=Duganella lactea TaxID=2692173 RepID=A0ABW9V6D3_9BURK|nr:MBOAT family O-acyltransferase [Duganella lactea]MYM35226.1 MBOAT family protein [Duganella lactea]
MLFNSLSFIVLFLPITTLGFFLLARRSQTWAALWLAAASLFFYGWWSVEYIPLLLASVTGNYLLGRRLPGSARRRWLVLGVSGNLLLLTYFKYADFFITGINAVAATQWPLWHVVLPIGMSFYTFTQIAFLVDTYHGKVKEYRFVHYLLFITYFPHLIAGPVLHHAEMMPQFARLATYRFSRANLAIGGSIFVFGLAKKVLIADHLAPHANSFFGQTEPQTLLVAWGGVLAYAFQLYFDFSGYSDMAIGASRLFGIRLPLNFDSPYKAASVIDFWRRWHMTLSRFLRDYLYIPLGGARKGSLRRHLNLLLTMLLGGLWHGAGWNFALWGLLHGAYLMVNHAWAALAARLRFPVGAAAWRMPAAALTFAAVCVAWVFFRAADFSQALLIVGAMAGHNGASLPEALAPRVMGIQPMLDALGITFHVGGGTRFVQTYAWVAVAAAIAWLMPNTQQIMARFEPTLGARWPAWLPNRRWAVGMALLSLACLLSLGRPAEFLYFQF